MLFFSFSEWESNIVKLQNDERMSQWWVCWHWRELVGDRVNDNYRFSLTDSPSPVSNTSNAASSLDIFKSFRICCLSPATKTNRFIHSIRVSEFFCVSSSYFSFAVVEVFRSIETKKFYFWTKNYKKNYCDQRRDFFLCSLLLFSVENKEKRLNRSRRDFFVFVKLKFCCCLLSNKSDFSSHY